MIQLTYSFQTIEELNQFLIKQKNAEPKPRPVATEVQVPSNAPVSAPAASSEDKPRKKKDDHGLTLDDAREALQKVSAKFGIEHAKRFMIAFKGKGHQRVSAVVKADFPDFVAYCEEELKKPAPGAAQANG